MKAINKEKSILISELNIDFSDLLLYSKINDEQTVLMFRDNLFTFCTSTGSTRYWTIFIYKAYDDFLDDFRMFYIGANYSARKLYEQIKDTFFNYTNFKIQYRKEIL
jgi:hypothetical protein